MLGPVTSLPTSPPASGPAVEVPPHGEHWRPQTTVYPHPGPSLVVYWPNFWQTATVRAKQEYPNGLIAVQVELKPTADSHTMVIRTFAWGKDNLRSVEPEA